MRTTTATLLAVLSLAAALPASAQPSTRVQTLDELLNRTGLPGETVWCETGLGGIDWGGGRWITHRLAITGTTNVGNTWARKNGGYWQTLDNTAEEQKAAWFGSVPESGDAAVGIQAALDYASPRSGIVRLQGGVYFIGSTIGLPPNVRLVGGGPAEGYYSPHAFNTNIATDLSYIRKSGRTVLFMVNAANKPMFTNQMTGFALPTATSIYDGRGVITPRFLNSSIEDVTLDGNGDNQTRYDCDLIRLTDCWNFTLRNVYFFRPSGYWLRAWNCNVIRVGDFIFNSGRSTKGVLLWDTSDTSIKNGMSGGNIGPSIWLASPSTWFNNISDLHIGDANWRNTGGTLLSVAGNSMTLDRDPKLETGDPFVFWRGRNGVLPAGITNGQVYFAVREATNVFGFSWNLTNALAGGKDAIADIGTDIAIKPGPSVAMAFNQATYNVVDNVRFDSSADGNVVFEDADYNTIANSQVLRAGGLDYQTTNAVGIWLREGSGNNQLSRITSWYNHTGVRVDSPNNYLDGATFGQTTVPFDVQTSISVGMSYVLQYGGTNSTLTNLVGKQLLFEGDVFAIPVKFVGTNTPSILELRRVGSNPGAARLGIARNSDGLPALTFADGDSGSRIASLSGSTTNSQIVIGGDEDARTTVRTMLRPGDPKGTNRNGFDLEVQGGNPTGNGTPGRVSLRASVTGSSGVGVRSTTEEIAGVTSRGLLVAAGKTLGIGAMSKATRDAIAGGDLINGLMVYQTDAGNYGPRWYSTTLGGWMKADGTADP